MAMEEDVELVIFFLHTNSHQTLRLVVSADTCVDLLAIADPFCLDPSSLRLNGHFLSRNPSFVCSLSWRQVLSFFHSRGFSSGRHPLDPVQVDGSSSLPPDANVDMCEESCLNAERSWNLKRSVEQAGLSPSITAEKRLRQESVSGTILSMSERLKLSSNPKGREREDDEAHCIREGRTGTVSSASHARVQLSKRKRKQDEETSAHGTWGKRSRHDGCSSILDTLQWRYQAELTP